MLPGLTLQSMNPGDILSAADPLLLTVWALFFVAVATQVYYLLGIQLRLGLYRPEEPPLSEAGISVVICARNEKENLERFLPLILKQDYPEFEVVVVDDASSDGTGEFLAFLSLSHTRLRHTSIPVNDQFRHGKKLALTIGLKAARYDHVLLTDADCYPDSGQWIRRMASRLDGDKTIVLGYGAYEHQKGVLNLLIRYETVVTAMMYLSCALKGRPYMGVGRNLGYDKSLYFRNQGFKNHYHLPSGDDDLFVNAHASGENTAVELRRDSFTRSLPKTSAGSWFRQKRRHLTAGVHYNRHTRMLLAGDWVSRLLIYAGFILCLSVTPWKWAAAALFLLYTAIRMVVLKLGMRRLYEKYLLVPSLLFDLILPLLLGIIWLSSLLDSKYRAWN